MRTTEPRCDRSAHADQYCSLRPDDPDTIKGHVAMTAPGRVASSGDPGLRAFTNRTEGSCESAAVLEYSGNYFNTEGVLYAPRGQAEHSGNNNVHQPGAIVAGTVKWWGNFNRIGASSTSRLAQQARATATVRIGPATAPSVSFRGTRPHRTSCHGA
jgi:hypothetical protein